MSVPIAHPSSPIPRVVAAVFDQPAAAQQALESFGLDPQRQLGLWAPPSDGRGLLVGINRAEELTAGLVSLGVPEGEARYLMDEVRNGRTLVVVDAGDRYAEVREQLLAEGGYDVQSRGGVPMTWGQSALNV